MQKLHIEQAFGGALLIGAVMILIRSMPAFSMARTAPHPKPISAEPSPSASPASPATRSIGSLSTANTSLSIQVRSVDELKALASVFSASGLFGRGQDHQQALATCCVQLLAGMEAGFTPFASITGIYLVNGKPGFSAQLLAQAVKRHPRYDYRVRQKDAECCTIAFLQDGDEIGVETFTMAMAKRAGLVGSRGPWAQYPEAMLFARCLTAGMRTHCPDALGGFAAYTPEEIGGSAIGEIDEHGMVVEVKPQPPAEPQIDRDQLSAMALRAVKASGLTAAGMRNMLTELGGDEINGIGQLDDAVLGRLARQGISGETVSRWNAEPEPVAEEQTASDDDELPLSWDAEK